MAWGIAEVMAAGLDVILPDEHVKSVFVNVFGGITACDAVANGIVQALDPGDEANKLLLVRSTATTSSRAGHPRRGEPPAGHRSGHDGRTADKAAELAAASN